MPFDKAAPHHGLLHCRTVCRSSVRFLSEKTQMWQHGTEPILPMLNPFISSRFDRQSCGSIPCDQSRNVAESKGVRILNRLQPSTTVFFLLYDSIWFSLIWFSLMMSHVIHKLVTCLDIVLKGPEGPEAHQLKLLLSRMPCRTSLRFVLDQDSEMHVWVALLVFCSWFCKLLLMCCSTCSNIIFTSKSPPSGKSGKV